MHLPVISPPQMIYTGLLTSQSKSWKDINGAANFI